jgi:multidrug efflux pump subunit AcrA (membrane-fusion protein)
MTTKHTPGPWHIESWRASWGPTLAVYPPEFPREGSRVPVAIEVADANARLISAAPDMLKALEFVLADLNSTLDPETASIIRNTINAATLANQE